MPKPDLAVDAAAELVDGRYRIDAVLGRGGMGTVYAVTDVATSAPLALKRPRPSAKSAPHAAFATEQFRREYQLLAELSHPSIIRVFDYGLDANGAYYTMELLSGHTLSDQGALDWRRCCELLRDVASSLAVIHARRLVHRDVTLRNVHYDAAERRCKLLDFGAVMSSGIAGSIVGTPPYLPKEALDGEALDGRADLFALGACLYCLLTGEHAYPALRTEDLPATWQKRPRPPHERNPSVPLALSELTMSLLSPDPLTRPNTAAEVMDRLSALAGLEVREPPAVRRAYMTAPALVGRARALQQLRAFTARGNATGGSALMISGPSGVGRSRILDACATEARLAGIHVLQCTARDAQADYAVARALVDEALKALPEAGSDPAAPALRRMLSAASGAEGALQPPADPASPRPEELRRNVLQALRRFFTRLASSRPLLLAVDDLERADEPSAAFLVALSEDLGSRPLRVVTSVASDRGPCALAAVEWLSAASTRVELQNLNREQVNELLGSVLGHGPNVTMLADRIHAVSGGHPQWVMQLAEHLVERGLVRYEAGAFLVPEQLSLDDLPTTLQDAFAASLSALATGARDLAQAYMLEPDAWYSRAELALLAELPASELAAALGELLQRGVLAAERERFGLVHHAFATVLRMRAEPAALCAWHARLARVFRDRGDLPRAAQHLWSAGERAAAVSALAEFAEALRAGMNTDSAPIDRVIATMPAGFVATLCSAVDACIELGRSKREELILRCACAQIGAMTFDGSEIAHLFVLLAQLRADAGLDAWERHGEIADPIARLTRALEETAARYHALPEHERGFAPDEAVPLLAEMVGHSIGVSAGGRDYRLAAALPSLAPLAPLSPLLEVIDELVNTTRDLGASRTERAVETYHVILAQLDGAHGAAMPPSIRRYIRLAIWHTLGMLAGDRGQLEALAWADKLDTEFLYEVNAWRVRRCYYRVRGEIEQAERCRRQAELLRIKQRSSQHMHGSQLGSDLVYCTSSEDLMSIKLAIEELQSVAQRFPGWKPVLAMARGVYCRLRGDLDEALAHAEEACALCAENGERWPQPVAERMAALVCLGRFAEAREIGRAWLAEPGGADVGEVGTGFRVWLAAAEAMLGNADAARTLADTVVANVEAARMSGLHAAVAYDARARICMMLGDREGFERDVARSALEYKRGRDPALWTRYDRLLRDARALGVREPEPIEEPCPEAESGSFEVFGRAALLREFAACEGPEQRAASLLGELARQCEASSGLLYVAAGGAMSLRARFGSAQTSSELAMNAPPMTTAALGHDTQRGSLLPQDVTLEAPPQSADDEYRSFLLTHEGDGETLLVGTALLKPAHDRAAAPSQGLLHLIAELLLESGDASPMRLR